MLRSLTRIRPPQLAHAATLAIVVGLSGCAIGDGEPFATLSASLRAGIEVDSGRDVGMGWQQLASGYQIKIDSLRIETDELTISGSGAEASSFDPANPPPGYSLCHNGHCHADDGRLVDYEDIAAELAQGAGASVVAALPVGEVDVAAGVERTLNCEPSCDLPLTNLVSARLSMQRIIADGMVRDERAEARIDGEVAWRLDVSLAEIAQLEPDFDLDNGLTLIWPMSLSTDRGSEPEIDIEFSIAVESALFDSVAWANIDVNADDVREPMANADARAAILDSLDRIEATVTIER